MHNSILITGCSSGIGLCAAQQLQKRGYRVFATARKAADVESLKKQGFESFTLDINDSNSITQAVQEVIKSTDGKLFALLNNAGYGQPGAVEDLSRELLRQQFETNVFGLQELTNQVLPIMRKQGYGRIINISSVLGLVSTPYRGAYSASKFAVEALTDALRLELKGSNIFVSLIEPGPIQSLFRDNALTAYEQNISSEQSIHRQNYQKVQNYYEKNKKPQPFMLPPEAVVNKIVNALTSNTPKARYYVTVPTYFLAFCKRILPTFMLDLLISNLSQQELE